MGIGPPHALRVPPETDVAAVERPGAEGEQDRVAAARLVKLGSEVISGQWITSRTEPSPISMFQFISRAPLSGSARKVEPPTRQRMSVWPK